MENKGEVCVPFQLVYSKSRSGDDDDDGNGEWNNHWRHRMNKNCYCAIEIAYMLQLQLNIDDGSKRQHKKKIRTYPGCIYPFLFAISANPSLSPFGL
jgi:hypothetical protein